MRRKARETAKILKWVDPNIELVTLATFDKEKGELAYFVLNTNVDSSVELELKLEEFGELEIIERQMLSGDDLFAVNSFEDPENVIPRSIDGNFKSGTQFFFVLPESSWTMIRFKQQ